jgi:putative nucleotidyltransferase with HDIG domain
VEGKLYPEQNREQVLSLIARCEDYLALPPVVQIILGVTSGRSTSAPTLATLIQSDPVLASGIIATANSPYFGFSKKISRVSHAVSVLGFQEIRNLVLSMSVVQLFEQRGFVSLDKLWRHSYAAGVATRMVAAFFKLKIESKFFLAGLLHDVGKLFLSQYLPDKYTEMLAILEREGGSITYHVLEESFFGISHAEIGRRLMAFWNFPEEVVHAVQFHHAPSNAPSDIILASCVHIADLICTVKGLSPLGDRYFLSMDKKVVPLLIGLKQNFCTEDLFSLMSQLDLEIDRQSGFVSAYKR